MNSDIILFPGVAKKEGGGDDKQFIVIPGICPSLWLQYYLWGWCNYGLVINIVSHQSSEGRHPNIEILYCWELFHTFHIMNLHINSGQICFETFEVCLSSADRILERKK